MSETIKTKLGDMNVIQLTSNSAMHEIKLKISDETQMVIDFINDIDCNKVFVSLNHKYGNLRINSYDTKESIYDIIEKSRYIVLNNHSLTVEIAGMFIRVDDKGYHIYIDIFTAGTINKTNIELPRATFVLNMDYDKDSDKIQDRDLLAKIDKDEIDPRKFYSVKEFIEANEERKFADNMRCKNAGINLDFTYKGPNTINPKGIDSLFSNERRILFDDSKSVFSSRYTNNPDRKYENKTYGCICRGESFVDNHDIYSDYIRINGHKICRYCGTPVVEIKDGKRYDANQYIKDIRVLLNKINICNTEIHSEDSINDIDGKINNIRNKDTIGEIQFKLDDLQDYLKGQGV